MTLTLTAKPESRSPWKRLFPAVPALALMLSLAAPCGAAEPAATPATGLPDGPAVLAKYAAAVGGVAAWDSIHNSKSRSVVTYQGTNTVLSSIEYRTRPNRVYTILDTPAGKFTSGVFDGNAWEYSVKQGSRLLEGQEQADAVRDANFDGLVHWRAMYRSCENTGVDTLGGRACYKVTLKPRLGPPETDYFDVESGLLTRSEGSHETQASGVATFKSEISDYRKVGEVLVAHKTQTDVLGQRLIVTITELEYNVELESDRFDPPSEVKSLIKARTK
jgi:hypothetical protein